MKPLRTLSQWAEAFTAPPTANGFLPNISRILGQLGIVELLREVSNTNIFRHDWPPTLESLGATSLTYTVEPAHQEATHDSSEHQAGMSESTNANSLTSWTEYASRPLPSPLLVPQVDQLFMLAGGRETNLRFSLFLQVYNAGIMDGFLFNEPQRSPGLDYAMAHAAHRNTMTEHLQRRAIHVDMLGLPIRPSPPSSLPRAPDNPPLTARLRRDLLEGFEIPFQRVPELLAEIDAQVRESMNRLATPPVQQPPNELPVRDPPARLEVLAGNRLPLADERPVRAGDGRNLPLRPHPPRNQGPPNRDNQERTPQLRPPRPVRHGRENTPIRAPPPPAANLPTCLVCADPVPGKKSSSETLPCGHVFCENCLAAGIRASLTNMPFVPVRCCQRIDMSVIRTSPKATSDEIQTYRKKLSEFDDGEPLYCHDPACSEFIPAALRSKNVAKCRRCHKKTCTLCRRAYHLRQCDHPAVNVKLPDDIHDWVGRTAWRAEMARRREAELRSQERQFKLLSRRSGWKPCPKCSTMIEKIEGCNHIHCTSCGTHFCYRCGQAPYDRHGPCAM